MGILKIFFFFLYFSYTSLLLPAHILSPSRMRAQSCKPMDCSLPGSSVYGLFQARTLEWVAISFSILKKNLLMVFKVFFFLIG